MYSNRPVVEINEEVQPSFGNCGHKVIECNSIASCIYLGPKYCCNDNDGISNLLNDNNVKGIVNCTLSVPCYHEDNNINYCRVGIHDEDAANILLYLNGATKFIHYYISRGESVVVHCEMGISRSASICIAYLIKYQGLTREEAYIKIKSKRPHICPNSGFWDQLNTFQLQCNNNNEEKDFNENYFENNWSEESFSFYSTTRSIVHTDEQCFSELLDNIEYIKTNNINLIILEAALDFIYSRVYDLKFDLKWFVSVLRLITKYTNVDSNVIIFELLDKSSIFFSDKWCGEYYADKVNDIKEAITEY
jgi:protein-tyrosine phosphatase